MKANPPPCADKGYVICKAQQCSYTAFGIMQKLDGGIVSPPLGVAVLAIILLVKNTP